MLLLLSFGIIEVRLKFSKNCRKCVNFMN